MSATRRTVWPLLLPFLGLSTACSDDPDESARPPCDEVCQDRVALRAVREMTKLAYNLLLQGNPVGLQQELAPCPLGGLVLVYGDASSNAAQGATEVDLVYAFQDCTHIEIDEEPDETYQMTLSGVLGQSGIIAAQPSATTALVMSSDSMTMSGTVYDPPLDYHADACVLELGQDGNDLAGLMCGREVGVDLGGQPGN
jgi:hypothetical protein